jgi:bifunctional pyridoxal-dependent enzyme with beta-cystathionase and maltose regulon repressor activities
MAKNDNMGRPAFILTDEQFKTIEGMARIQCTQVEICDIFDVTEKTLNVALKKHSGVTFSQLIKKNLSHGKASLRRSQWKLATDKLNPTMLVWLGKQHLGQTDKVESMDDADTPSININLTTSAPVGDVRVTRHKT